MVHHLSLKHAPHVSQTMRQWGWGWRERGAGWHHTCFINSVCSSVICSLTDRLGCGWNLQRFALSILDGTIQRAWHVLPAEQAEGIKEFVVRQAIELASSFETLESERTFVLKLNQVLIKIVVQEWPDKWPTFISDIVGASRSSESLCENNMRILKLLSDEVCLWCALSFHRTRDASVTLAFPPIVSASGRSRLMLRLPIKS